MEVSGLSERELARSAPLGHATMNHLVTVEAGAAARWRTAMAIERVFDVSPGTLFAAESDQEKIAVAALCT